MATVTITITDTEDENVKISAKFDPPLKHQDPDNMTDAQVMALSMCRFATENSEVTDSKFS